MRNLLIILCVILFLCLTIRFDIVPPIFWSFKSFVNLHYTEDLEKEWSQKDTSFLLEKLHSIDSMRFGLAAYILGQRKEARAIDILVKRILSRYTNDQIHFSACSALAQISPEKAKVILMKLVGKYYKLYSKSMMNKKYRNALQILATMKDERVYPICLEIAKSGNRLSEESSLNGMLYNFDNHWNEVLPLYLEYLNNNNRYDIDFIAGIKNLKRPEAIPALEEFASKNPSYKREAQEAINYLKSLQK